jgi:hypothetical protein
MTFDLCGHQCRWGRHESKTSINLMQGRTPHPYKGACFDWGSIVSMPRGRARLGPGHGASIDGQRP